MIRCEFVTHDQLSDTSRVRSLARDRDGLARVWPWHLAIVAVIARETAKIRQTDLRGLPTKDGPRRRSRFGGCAWRTLRPIVGRSCRVERPRAASMGERVRKV